MHCKDLGLLWHRSDTPLSSQSPVGSLPDQLRVNLSWGQSLDMLWPTQEVGRLSWIPACGNTRLQHHNGIFVLLGSGRTPGQQDILG